MVTDAVDVARFLIFLACHDDPEPDPLTNMRLQKLLYYAQGWPLAMRDRAGWPVHRAAMGGVTMIER